MNQTIQIFAGIALIIIPTVIMAIFWKVGTTVGIADDYKKISEKGYAVRRKYFVWLLVASAAFLSAGLYILPYPEFATAKTIEGERLHIVKATARQFGFELSETSLPLGIVRFDITSADVNHGFGIYNEEGNLISQTQAMPDYINRLYVNFNKPGKYHIWCLEYCGVAHHIMSTDFEIR